MAFQFPPGTQEAWSKLSQTLPVSKGTFAGPGKDDPNSTGTDMGKQWMRAVSLVVYGGVSQDYGGGQDTPKDPSSGVPNPANDPEIGHSPTAAATNVRFLFPTGRDENLGDPTGGDPPNYGDPTGGDPSLPAGKEQPSQPPSGGAGVGQTASTEQAASGPSEGLELGALRVTFNVHNNTVTTPNELNARVYNMAPETMKKVVQFGRVKLTAGYKYGQYGVIFDGKVMQYRRGKENPTDTYLEIIAFDGDDLSKSISARRYEAGTKESKVIKDLIKDTGMPEGHISDKVGTDVLVRPWVIAGMTQKYLRDLMLKYNANCWPDQGKLHIVSQRELLPGEAVVLSPRTGLVGIPEATPEGIQARCLLNPRLRAGTRVKLDNALISGVAFIPGQGEISGSTNLAGTQYDSAMGGNAGGVPIPGPTSPTGDYKIALIEWNGDSRGQPWYCDLVCVAVDKNGVVYPAVNTAWNRSPAVNQDQGGGAQQASGG